jgi:hypothetical protein
MAEVFLKQSLGQIDFASIGIEMHRYRHEVHQLATHGPIAKV